MGRNEIRLRKQKMSSGRIARHRNYAELMRKHKRGLKTKQLLLVVIYTIEILLLLLLSFIAIRIEKNKGRKSTSTCIDPRYISISTHLTLPWKDEQRQSSPHNATA